MLNARVDINGSTPTTVNVQITVFPTIPSDYPVIGGYDVLDNSSPPVSLLGGAVDAAECVTRLGVENPLLIPGIPITRLLISLTIFKCPFGTGVLNNFGPFLQEMSPGGDVPCGTGLILPPSLNCTIAQTDVSNARANFVAECSNIADARGRRDSSVAAAVGFGAAGIAAGAGAAAIIAAIIQAAGTAAATALVSAAVVGSIAWVGWIAAAILIVIAAGFLVAAGILIATFINAQDVLNQSYARQVQHLSTFNSAVRQLHVVCCPEQIPSTLDLSPPTCP